MTTVANGEAALSALDKHLPSLVLTDLKMPGMSGIELLEQIRLREPDLPVIMITAFGTIQSAVQAVKAGAYDYLTNQSIRKTCSSSSTARWSARSLSMKS